MDKTTDEARAALLASWSLKEPTPKLAAFEAAIRAESARSWSEAMESVNADRAAAEAKLAALREAAQQLDDALRARIPSLSRQQWITVDGLRAALAATPAEDEEGRT